MIILYLLTSSRVTSYDKVYGMIILDLDVLYLKILKSVCLTG